MRKTLGICLLTLLLTGSVSAGEMPNWSPVPPPAVTQQDTSASVEDGTQGSLTQGLLDLLASLSSLF